jgi:hypothetical protein
MNSLFAELQDVFYGIEKKYLTFAGYLMLAALLVGGSYLGYTSWRTSHNEKAQISLMESVNDLNTAVHAMGNAQVPELEVQQLFKSVKTDMEIGYSKYKWSSLAPFFLVYQAQAMTYLNEKEEAYSLMQKAVGHFSSSSPYHMMYSIQVALRALDLGKLQEGESQLKVLAASKNDMADMAAYYLAHYYLEHDNKAKGKELLKSIVERAKKSSENGLMPFQQLAAQQLEVIV